MILIDANLLLYAHQRGSEFAELAGDWLERTFNGHEPIGLAWTVILAFLRISTHPQVYRISYTAAESTAVVATWIERPNVTVLTPTERHWELFSRLVREAQATGDLIMDAHLAALAMEYGAILYTTDRDFSRFSGVRTVNPLKNPR